MNVALKSLIFAVGYFTALSLSAPSVGAAESNPDDTSLVGSAECLNNNHIVEIARQQFNDLSSKAPLTSAKYDELRVEAIATIDAIWDCNSSAERARFLQINIARKPIETGWHSPGCRGLAPAIKNAREAIAHIGNNRKKSYSYIVALNSYEDDIQDYMTDCSVEAEPN